MAKKRIVKKRTTKRKIAKKVLQPNDKKPDLTHMTKLEYEQSMMDPRFRAAMAGFNQAPPFNQQLNQRMDDMNKRIGDNNTLTNQITLMNEKANIDKKNAQLKAELKAAKENATTEKARIEAEMKSKQLQRELEQTNTNHALQQELYEKQITLNDTRYQAQLESQQLQNKIDKQERRFQQQKVEYENAEVKANQQFELTMKQLKSQHDDEVLPLKQAIGDLSRSINEKLEKFSNSEEIADASAKLVSTQLKKDFEDTIIPLKEAINEKQNEMALQKQLNEQDSELMKTEFDSLKTELLAEFHSQISPIQQQTQQLKNDMELNKAANDNQAELMKAQTENVIEKMKSTFSPYIEKLNQQSEALKQEMDRLQTHSKYLKEFKSAQDKFFDENLRKQFEPAINELKTEANRLKSENDKAKAIHQNHMEVSKAQTELTAEQIKAINEPTIRALQSQKQQLENMLKINGDINGIAEKIENIQTDITLLKQKASPEQIQEYGKNIREATLKTAPLLIDKRLLEKYNELNIQYENEFKGVVEAGVRAFGEDFKQEDIGKPELREKVKTAMIEKQKEFAKVAGQRESIERQISLTKSLEQEKIELAAANARLEMVGDHSSEYNKALIETAKKKVAIEEETRNLEGLTGQMREIKQHSDEVYAKTLKKFNKFMNVDPYVKRVAQEITGQENPDPRCLPDVLEALKSTNETVQTAIVEMSPQYLVAPDENDRSERATHLRNLQSAICQTAKELDKEGIHLWQDKNNLRLERDTAQTDREIAVREKWDAQKRLKQAATFVGSVYHDATVPIRKGTTSDDDPTSTYYESANPKPGDPSSDKTIYRGFYPQSRLQVTSERMDNWKRTSKINDIPTFVQNAVAIEIPPEASDSSFSSSQISENN